MAKTNERIMSMVQRAIDKNPDVKSGPLYEQAKKADRSVGRLSLRQFHALYPLQIKRRMKAGTPKAKVKKAAGRPPGRRPGRPPRSPAASAAPAKTPAAKAPARGAEPGRDAIRAVLVDFASTIAKADSKSDMIAVMGGLDRWVNRVASAAR